jgi:uncharacterized protein (TIGR03084 family)
LAPTIVDLCADLAAEQASLDAVVADLPVVSWSRPTPAAGWDIRDTISHLCFFDEAATLALTDPPAFEAVRQQVADCPADRTPPDLARGRGDPDELDEPDQPATAGSSGDPGPLLDRWRASHHATRSAIASAHAADPRARVPWFGPPMSLASFATARLMETWAHGVDVRDALGVPLEPTPRLRHVIHLGVNARPFAFTVHDVDDPGNPIRVEATAPDGAIWAWGPEDASDRVTGSALDLALVLTQRRHRARTAVTVTGPTAVAWLDVAQAFAGPPTTTSLDR